MSGTARRGAFYGTRRDAPAADRGERTWRCRTCRGPVDGHEERSCPVPIELLNDSVEHSVAAGIGP